MQIETRANVFNLVLVYIGIILLMYSYLGIDFHIISLYYIVTYIQLITTERDSKAYKLLSQRPNLPSEQYFFFYKYSEFMFSFVCDHTRMNPEFHFQTVVI